MILIDFSGVFFTSVFVELKRSLTKQVDIGYLRNMILRQIYSYKKQFSDEYGQLVFCFDSKDPWRKDVFPLYKFARKKARIDSGIDWDKIFDDVSKIENEIKEVLPYKFIQVPKLEADDIIAILTKNASKLDEEKVLIISNDKDYKQLHKFKYVKQFTPRDKILKKEPNPDFELLSLILHGDSSDGIPNIKSPEDSFEKGIRQKRITTVFMKKVLKEGLSCLSESELERYKENERLISFEFIPEEYESLVLGEYKKNKVYSEMKLFKYFCQTSQQSLLEKVEDFEVKNAKFNETSRDLSDFYAD